MTTIGYGSYSPSTRAGKLFVTLYTIVSVPLFLVSLAHLSSSMAKLGQFVAGRFQTNGSESKTFVFGIFALGVFYLLGSAVIFAEGHTGWDYLDAVYYAVITLFTVGLGDYTPSLNEQSIVGFLVYTFLGLLLIGTISKSIQRVYDGLANYVTQSFHIWVSRVKGKRQAVANELSREAALVRSALSA